MTNTPTILIVEDDDNLRLTLSDILEGEDYQVYQAECIATAEQTIQKVSCQLVVLDLMLPDGDGYSFCKRLRERGNGTPVLMLTAFQHRSILGESENLTIPSVEGYFYPIIGIY